MGFRTREQAILINEFDKYSGSLVVATDDGSLGFKGTAVDVAKQLLETNSYTAIYTCGREQMMYKLALLAKSHRVRVQVLLERLIKCGIGICGSCVLEPLGLRVCVDGPVFDGETLLATQDFGKYWHNSTGRRVPIEEISK